MSKRCSCSWRRARGLMIALVALLLSLPLQAQPDPAGGAAAADSSPAPAEEAAKLEEAKKLFHQGNELRKVKDYERALDYYARSRALVPSGPNTMNAAFCLDKLGRADEALEMYEQLLTNWPDKITAADRQTVTTTVERLRQQVGSIEIDANVDGQLLVEGRPRGEIPRPTPVRVMPGKRKVRIIKPGYRPFEKSVEVAAGETIKVEATLELQPTGRITISEQAVTCKGADPAYCTAAEVWVDGALIGTVPWEGELGAGDHWLQLRRGDMGSAPLALMVVKGQSVAPEVTMAPLGPDIAFEVVPDTAKLRIGGVVLGEGAWRGRLPIGAHDVKATEEGYLDHEHSVRIDRWSKGKVSIELEVDEDHERWAGSDTEMGAAGVLTFVGFGLGAAGIVVGSVFGTMTMSEQQDLDDQCTNDHCTEDEIDSLRNQAHVSTAGFVVAGAGVALGTVAMILWLSDSDDTEEQARLGLRPYGQGGLMLEGRF